MVDATWSPWQAWSNCPCGEGKGTVTRTRQCKTKHPTQSAPCQGKDTEEKQCAKKPCDDSSASGDSSPTREYKRYVAFSPEGRGGGDLSICSGSGRNHVIFVVLTDFYKRSLCAGVDPFLDWSGQISSWKIIIDWYCSSLIKLVILLICCSCFDLIFVDAPK